MQPEHLNRKFPPYTTRHPSDSQSQSAFLPANNATEPYYTASPPIQQLLHIGPPHVHTFTPSQDSLSSPSNNSVVSKPSSHSFSNSPTSEERNKNFQAMEKECRSLFY